MTCDVTPHHLALTDEWIAGSRRWAWEALDADGAARDPWADGALDGGAVRPVAARQPAAPAAPRTRPPCLAALVDGTADAIATDHAPHTEVDKHVEFGWAANGISGIETAIGLVLAAVDAGVLPLARAIEALTTGPAAGARAAAAVTPGPARGRARGPRRHRPRRDRGRVDGRRRCGSKGKNSPLLGPRAARRRAADARRRPRRLRRGLTIRAPGRRRAAARASRPGPRPGLPAAAGEDLAGDRVGRRPSRSSGSRPYSGWLASYWNTRPRM